MIFLFIGLVFLFITYIIYRDKKDALFMAFPLLISFLFIWMSLYFNIYIRVNKILYYNDGMGEIICFDRPDNIIQYYEIENINKECGGFFEIAMALTDEYKGHQTDNYCCNVFWKRAEYQCLKHFIKYYSKECKIEWDIYDGRIQSLYGYEQAQEKLIKIFSGIMPGVFIGFAVFILYKMMKKVYIH